MTAGPIDTGTPLGKRVTERLRTEKAIWLTTVGPDGTPQPNPVWFLWNGATSVVVYNRADAFRLEHVRSRPAVSLHFDGDGVGGNIVVVAGTARVSEDVPPAVQNAEYLRKYESGIARVSGSVETFGAAYPVALVVELRRIRGH